MQKRQIVLRYTLSATPAAAAGRSHAACDKNIILADADLQTSSRRHSHIEVPGDLAVAEAQGDTSPCAQSLRTEEPNLTAIYQAHPLRPTPASPASPSRRR